MTKRSGDPHINFALSILLDAKQDAKMWLDFKEEFEYSNNISSSEIAEWVTEWLLKNRTEGEARDIDLKDIKAISKLLKEGKNEQETK